MRCHDVDFQIVGDDMQMVLVELDPGETVIAEAGGSNQGEGSVMGGLGRLFEDR